MPLEGPSPPVFLPIPSASSQSYRALEPNRVYNVDDQKFYRTRASLERTALPRSLAPGGSTTGDYHTITLR